MFCPKNVTAKELRDAYDRGQRSFCGADLRSLNLNEFDLSGIELMQAQLSSGNLNFVNFQGANLSEADFSLATLWRSNLRRTKLVNGCGDRSILIRSDLSHSICCGVSLQFADLRLADLRGVDLSQANLTGANLSYANLCGANLTGVNLRYANLTAANFTGAILNHANLSHAQLERIQWANATLVEVDWGETIADPDSKSNQKQTGVNQRILKPNHKPVSLLQTPKELSRTWESR
jgi:uncharacterized protein YjbI with pentapeptide repeats